MPLLGFTKLKNKLLDGSKTQTIRKPRKHPIKVGDKLYIYWKLRAKECEKLGEGIVTKTNRKRLGEFTLKDIQKDGFESYAHFDVVFCHEMHSKVSMQDEFDIITWRWIDKKIYEIGCLFCSCKYRGKNAFDKCVKHMDKEHVEEMVANRMTYPINYSKQWINGKCYPFIP